MDGGSEVGGQRLCGSVRLRGFQGGAVGGRGRVLYVTSRGDGHKGCMRRVEREGGQLREAAGPIRRGLLGHSAVEVMFEGATKRIRGMLRGERGRGRAMQRQGAGCG